MPTPRYARFMHRRCCKKTACTSLLHHHILMHQLKYKLVVLRYSLRNTCLRRVCPSAYYSQAMPQIGPLICRESLSLVTATSQRSSQSPKMFIFNSTGRCHATDCSLCSDGYAESYRFTCDTCPGKGSVIVLAAALAVIVVIGAAGVASYTMSGQLGRRGQGTIERLTRFIPLPSLKIVIVVFQIVTQVILAHKSSRLKVCKLIFMVPSILGRMSPNYCRPWLFG